jgi:hypothetical protein
MLILKYFLSVGTVLMIGLFALSARMETDKAASSPRIHSSASIAIAPPPPAPAAKTIQIDEPIAPVAESKTRHSSTPRASGSAHRSERTYYRPQQQQAQQRSPGFFRW